MKILIADDENDLTEIIEFIVHDKFPKLTQTFIAKNSVEAIAILKTELIDYVISDHNMPGGNGNEILAYIIANKLNTKHIICSTVNHEDFPDLYPPGNIFFQIIKPAITEGVKALAALVKDQTPASVPQEETVFIPITIRFLNLLGKAPADLYIQISETKYIKCINVNEPFTEEDNHKFLNKNVNSLCVKKPYDENAVTTLLNSVIDHIMAKQSISLNEKMATVHEQLFKLLAFTEVSEKLKEVTKANISQTVSLMMKHEVLADFWKEINLMGEYPSQLYSLHSTIASIIVKKLTWSSEATMYKLTMAAFMQDISLTSVALMKIFDSQHFLEIQETLSDKEIKCFLDHPVKSSDLVKTFKEIPPDVDKMVLEQNEMPDGSGFPRRMNASQISPLSCLFILSGLMAREILAEGKKFNVQNFTAKLENKGYSRGNFKDTFNVIKKM